MWHAKPSAVFLLLMLTHPWPLGCDRAPSPSNGKLARELDSIKKEISQLRTHVLLLDRRVYTNEKRFDRYSTAEFDPTSAEGFVRLDTALGSLAISLQDVMPFADGTQVQFHIANLSAATITAASYGLAWGPRKPKMPEVGSPEFQDYLTRTAEWQEKIQYKVGRIPKKLKPGVWTKVAIKLPETRPEGLGYLSISIVPEQIALPIEP